MNHLHLYECHCGCVFFLELGTTHIYKHFKIICLLSTSIILIPASMENVRLVGRQWNTFYQCVQNNDN